MADERHHNMADEQHHGEIEIERVEAGRKGGEAITAGAIPTTRAITVD